jgi:hypothetical protein
MLPGVQAAIDRPVLRRPRGTTRLFAGLRSGRARTVVHGITARARRPLLYLGAGGSVCHAAWQIWEPLGWLTLAAGLIVADDLLSDDEAS